MMLWHWRADEVRNGNRNYTERANIGGFSENDEAEAERGQNDGQDPPALAPFERSRFAAGELWRQAEGGRQIEYCEPGKTPQQAAAPNYGSPHR